MLYKSNHHHLEKKTDRLADGGGGGGGQHKGRERGTEREIQGVYKKGYTLTWNVEV